MSTSLGSDKGPLSSVCNTSHIALLYTDWLPLGFPTHQSQIFSSDFDNSHVNRSPQDRQALLHLCFHASRIDGPQLRCIEVGRVIL